MAKKDYSELAKTIVDNVGGEENIDNVIHCITRLRFYLKDEDKANDDVIANQDGVINVLHASGQYQVVIGNEVSNVYDAVINELGEVDSSQQTTSTQTRSGFKERIEDLIGFITGAMSPVVGIIAASGIIKGLLALLTLPQLGNLVDPASMLYQTVSAMADASFFFLPVLVGFSAAQRVKADPIVTGTIGLFLTYPSIVEWGKDFTTMFSVSGLNFPVLNYSYSIFPMILAAWMVKKLQDWLKEHLPSYLQMIFVPLIVLLIVSTITLTITGPVIQGLANGIATLINFLVRSSGFLGGLVIGGLYQILVIFGLHWGVVPLVAQQIASNGESMLNAIISGTMVAQGAAVLAVAIKSKKDGLKTLGIAAAISAFFGVTEPAIYGINLRFRKVFISGLVGSAVAGLITGAMGGSMFGFTGSLIGFSSFFNPQAPTELTSFYAFLLSSLAAIVVSFTLTWVWGYNDNMEMGEKVEKKERPGSKKKITAPAVTVEQSSEEQLIQPVQGKQIPLEEVKDEVFSSGAMGKGFGIEPTEGVLRAPVDAEVTVAFETGHAIGLTSINGAEILLHIGIDTVMMNGDGFEVLVSQEQFVKQGDPLVRFDIDKIKKAGYDPTVMLVVTDPHGVNVRFPEP